MSSAFDSVLDQALQLPVEERSRIATRLIESVDEAEDEQVFLSEPWKEEIKQRIENLRQGTAKSVPHDAVMNGLRQMLATKRQKG